MSIDMKFSSQAVQKEWSTGGIGSLCLFSLSWGRPGRARATPQKGSKGVQKAKIEPERKTGHDFEVSRRDLKGIWRLLGGHLEATWRPLGVQDAPEVQQKSSKGVQKAKIEPERESEHDFGGQLGSLGSHSEST